MMSTLAVMAGFASHRRHNPRLGWTFAKINQMHAPRSCQRASSRWLVKAKSEGAAPARLLHTRSPICFYIRQQLS